MALKGRDLHAAAAAAAKIDFLLFFLTQEKHQKDESKLSLV